MNMTAQNMENNQGQLPPKGCSWLGGIAIQMDMRLSFQK